MYDGYTHMDCVALFRQLCGSSIWIVSSSSPGILLRSSLSTRSITLSALANVGRPVEVSDCNEESCMRMLPIVLDESLGQKRGLVYEARPSTSRSYACRPSARIFTVKFRTYFR